MHQLDLTLYLIVKNEKIHLPSCLESFKGIWKKLLIVDTGSTDNTKEIAASYGARILEFQWIDDFSAARNFALDHVDTEWVMMVDADDTIETEDKQNLAEYLNTEIKKNDLVLLPYIYFGDKNNQHLVHYFPRVWKTSKNYRYLRPIHELLNHDDIGGRRAFVDIPIIHSKKIPHQHSIDRNIKMLEKHIENDPTGKLSIFYLGLEYKDMGNMEKAVEYYQKYIDSQPKDPNRLYEAYTRCGLYYFKTGNPDKARLYFSNAIKLCPDFIEPYLYLAELEMHLYSIPRAIQILQKARLLTPPKVFIPYEKSLYYGFAERLLHIANQKLKHA